MGARIAACPRRRVWGWVRSWHGWMNERGNLLPYLKLMTRGENKKSGNLFCEHCTFMLPGLRSLPCGARAAA